MIEMVRVKVISDIVAIVEKELANFETAIANDLSMPRASSSLFLIVKSAEKGFKRVAKAKDAKDWEMADSLRAMIAELGFTLKDVKGGDTIVSKV